VRPGRAPDPADSGRIFAGGELRRIDEDARHDVLLLGSGAAHQLEMPAMQRTHGGHNADAAAEGSPRPAQRGD
jgi:hypothetical protein